MGFLGMGMIGGILAAGKKPKVPSYLAVNADQEQKNAIQGNLDVLPEATALASKFNTFNADQIAEMLKKSSPEFFGLRDKQAGMIQSELQGQIPENIQRQFRNTLGRNVSMRDLGGTDQQLRLQGANSASRWMAQTQMLEPNLFDFSTAFMTPMQRISIASQNNEGQMGQQWLQNKINAMPDPKMAAIGNYMINSDDQLSSAVGSVAGGMASKAGGK